VYPPAPNTIRSHVSRIDGRQIQLAPQSRELVAAARLAQHFADSSRFRARITRLKATPPRARAAHHRRTTCPRWASTWRAERPFAGSSAPCAQTRARLRCSRFAEIDVAKRRSSLVSDHAHHSPPASHVRQRAITTPPRSHIHVELVDRAFTAIRSSALSARSHTPPSEAATPQYEGGLVRLGRRGGRSMPAVQHTGATRRA